MKLSDSQVEDMVVLWEQLFDNAVEGLLLNQIVCPWSKRVIRVDSRMPARHGWILHAIGIAWRLKLEPDLIG